MTVSHMGPDGEQEEPWTTGQDNDVADKAEGEGSDEPIELSEEATQLDLEDDDPPLPWLQGDDDDDDFEGAGIGQTLGFVVLGLLVVNTLHFANINRLVPRQEGEVIKGGFEGGVITFPQEGTPYGFKNFPFLSPIGVPCQQPPFGVISVFDIKTRKLVWSKPLGTAEGSGPLGIPSHLPLRLGAPNFGGSLTTAGGLVFIAGGQDRRLRGDDPDDLTLREARLLGSADVLAHEPGVPAAILDRARADAARVALGVGEEAAALPGLGVVLRAADQRAGRALAMIALAEGPGMAKWPPAAMTTYWRPVRGET
jgi:hypothetical protein